MYDSLINILLGFAEGLGLVFSPCILPILPIVLSGSLTGSKQRPLGIIFGFVIVFALFTFFSRKLVALSGIDLNLVRHFSFALLILLGIIMISTTLTDKFSLLTQRLANIGTSSQKLNNTEGGFGSGLLLGTLIAFIWTPCAGPILAAVIVQTVLQKSTFQSFLVLFAFGVGAAIPMLLIAWLGRTVIDKLSFFKKHTIALRKALGFIIIATVGVMIYNESYSISSPTFTIQSNKPVEQTGLINGITPSKAPDFASITAWVNSPPLTMESLRGKVVLIDFWTYSCINCLRTLPYLKSWYDKYHDKGLVIIGVHTPEFEFEKNEDNVRNAIVKLGIRYPVAIDSNYGTWLNYSNQYWPAHYLIDKNGNVVYRHFGEGEYDVTENNIRFLLGLNQISEETPASENLAKMFVRISPETYLGYARSSLLARPDHISKETEATYQFPTHLDENAWALQGKWVVRSENIMTAAPGASLEMKFHAKHVYVVMGNQSPKPIHVKVKLNDKPLTQNQGNDVKESMIEVTGHRLYDVLSFDTATDGIIELTADDANLEFYTFTFGS